MGWRKEEGFGHIAYISREYLERTVKMQADKIIQQRDMLSSLQAVNVRDVRKTTIAEAFRFFLAVVSGKIIRGK